VPSGDQVERTKKKWEAERVVAEVKSPYGEGKGWGEITQSFSQENIEALILDCIGYTSQDKQQLQNILPCPILLPRAILSHAINQIF
jgi:protein AroM